MDLLALPLRTAEFLAVDTETNGLGGDACEVTEVGAVLVGGGELHDRFASLCAVRAPLSRGIQRLTGITQAMVDEAPEAEIVLADLVAALDGRVLVAHNASFDRRVLRQACERQGLPWPDPPTLCTVALARRFAPLVRQRRLVPLAESLGIEVAERHRALADAETCGRVFCALLPRLAAHAPTVGDAIALLRPARAPGGGRRRPTAAGTVRAGAGRGRRSAARGPCARRRSTAWPARASCPTSRASTSSATPADSRCTSASRSRCARACAPTSRHRASRRPGRRRRRASTTSRRRPSSARSCSRTG
ncbi:MAG: 3'-5' exonuclease [Solirubrobacterales bacterium]